MTTEEMKTLSTFADSDWDFTTPVWKICEGTNYPKLAWQTISVGDIVCPDGVETFDFAVFAAWWLENGCGDCGGADLTGDGVVDIDDLQTIAANWLN